MSPKGTRARSHVHSQRHGRFIVHGVLLLLAFAAVVVTARNPLNTSAAVLPEPPSFAFSGVVGVSQAAHDSYLRPTVSHETLESTVARSAISEVLGLRAAGAIEPSSSLSTGITAAAATDSDGGVTSLADFLDPRDPYFFYTTQAGDSLSLIAQTYGLSIDSILDNNATVVDADSIILGQELLIPRVDGILHEVARGETLASIIEKYDDVTSAAVLEYSPNQLDSADDIKTGQYVLMPGASVKPPPPPPPSAPTSSGGPPPPQGEGIFDYPLADWTLVTTDFGEYRGPGRTHTGIDLAGFRNAPVYSACDGIVTKTAWWTYSYGFHVIVDCGDGWTTLYAHFSDIYVAEGQFVASGTQLGLTGSTGYSTGDHLHFEIRRYGNYYDPAAYLPNFYN